MIEDALNGIAERILNLDEASLAGLWKKYKERMERFDTSKEWERAVIIFLYLRRCIVARRHRRIFGY